MTEVNRKEETTRNVHRVNNKRNVMSKKMNYNGLKTGYEEKPN
jgi:hypothetical protein